MTGLPSIAAVLAVVATFAATLAPVAPDPAGATPPAAAVAGATPAAVAGRSLPAIPRVPDGALLVGADQQYALYHANRFDPATGRLDLLLVSLADGHVVRTVAGPDVQCCDGVHVRYVDGSILMEVADGSVVRSDALTGEVTGTIPPSITGREDYLALDDRWVLTPTAVRWFDGPVVPVLGELPQDRFARTLGDSDLAVLTGTDGSDPLVLTPSTGAIVPLTRADETVRVFAARGGPSPEVYGRVEPDDPSDEEAEDGLVRWTDPAHAAGRTVVESDVEPAGHRLIASVRKDRWSVESVVEVDTATGRTSPALTDRVLAESTIGDWPRVPGETVVQAGDGVLVSRYHDRRGALTLIAGDGSRPLGALRRTQHSACRLYREGDHVEVDLCSGISGYPQVHTYLGTRAIAVGQRAWQETSGPLIMPVRAVPLGQRRLASCPDGGVPTVRDSRGRWQLERCPGGYRWYVTDTLGHLDPWLVRGEPRLGQDHVLERVASQVEGRDVLRVTGLDVRHQTRLFGPLGVDYTVDQAGDHSPIYVDASGRVRIADSAGLADSTPPTLSVLRRPSRFVNAVEPVRLSYIARAQDAVDGSHVTVTLQARMAQPRSPSLGEWQAVARSGPGRYRVTARPGEQWCVRFVAYDRSGNERISPVSCTVVPVDDAASWRDGAARRVAGDCLGGAATRLDQPDGALVVAGLQDSRVVVWLRTGPGHGQLVVRDGDRVVRRVDTAARRPGLRTVVLDPAARVRLEAGGRRAVLVDAIGHLRPQ
jgi:hypothetical protein